MKPDNQPPEYRAWWEISADFKPLEDRLAALTPREGRLNRDRLMFLAGQASVANTSITPTRLFGVPLGSRLWPTALAGMTALAATLVAILISKTVFLGPPAMQSGSVANNAQRTLSPQYIDDDRTRISSDVLSTRDSYRRIVERLLAGHEDLSADVMTMERFPTGDPDHPMLTPAAWRQISIGTESVGPPANDSSSLSTLRGFNS